MSADPAGSILILLASARSGGDTAKAVEMLVERLSSGTAEILDLSTRRILPFDYAEPAPQDDHASVVDAMLRHRSLVFATPVYWYAMSGVMKTFVDRFTDLLSPRDPMKRGRQLAGRETWLLAVGSGSTLPEGFETPFRRTSDYFGMNWRGSCYVKSRNGPDPLPLDDFAHALRLPRSPA